MTRYFCNYCNTEITDDNRVKPVSRYMTAFGKNAYCDEVLIQFSMFVERTTTTIAPLTDTDICFPCVLRVMRDVIEKHQKKMV